MTDSQQTPNTRLARVFPRKTSATPTDELAFFGEPGLFPPDVDAVHVSVAFTWDTGRAEQLARAWERIAPVEVGGPGTGMRGDEFKPGKYLREGHVITSRGCPNQCWFCSVPKREGNIRELPITDGWIVQDDNLLACSEDHIRRVFAMLRRQTKRVSFRGGLEAARLAGWHVDLLCGLSIRPEVFFAYDTPDDWEPLVVAVKKLLHAGFTTASHRLRCYVLIGHPRDTLDAADSRMRAVQSLGFTPMAMLWRPVDGTTTPQWRRFQRMWARPAIIHRQ